MDAGGNNSFLQDKCSNNVLCWRTWSAGRHPLVAAVAAIFVLGLTAGVYFAFGSPMYPVLTLLVLGAALSPYYLPARFTLDNEGLTVSSLLGHRQKLWSAFSAYFPNGEDGVLVSPIARQGLVSATRGIYLPYANNREAVLEYLARHLPQDR